MPFRPVGLEENSDASPFPPPMRLAWPAYTNEAIFLFHATALVFFSSFPAFQQRGDALY